METNFKCGDIVLLNRIGRSSSWYSKLIRFFTKRPYTHCAVVIHNVLDMPSVISSDKCVNIIPLQKHLDELDTQIEIFSLVDINDEKAESILRVLYSKYSGEIYGYSQLLFFIYRWLMSIFGIDVKNNKNIFTNGQICSEVVYRFLKYTYGDNMIFQNVMNQYNYNTVHTGDISDIIKQFPNLFVKKV